MSDDFDSRRRFPRVPSANTLLVKRLGNETLEEFARTSTMGEGGCSFSSDEELGVGAILEILISVEQKVVKSKAHVVYENQSEDGRWEVGVEFVELDSDDRHIINAILEKEDESPE